MLTQKQRVSNIVTAAVMFDAMGKYVEIKTADEIRELYGPGGVTGFIEDPKGHIAFGLDTLAPDEETDDGQLTKVISRMLIVCRGYNHLAFVRAHIAAMRERTIGWGKGTKSGVREAERFFEGDRTARDPLQPAPYDPTNGSGNGVVMKIGPVGAYYGIMQRGFYRSPLFDVVMRLGFLTHGDPRASVAAYCMASAVAKLLYQPIGDSDFEAKQFLSFLTEEAQYAESRQHEFGKFPEFAQTISERLRLIHDDYEVLCRSGTTSKIIGTSCLVTESFPFCVLTFLKNRSDFRKGVLQAINAGGDTDTNGSITSVLLAANGLEIPEEWFTYSDRFAHAFALGSELYDSAASVLGA